MRICTAKLKNILSIDLNIEPYTVEKLYHGSKKLTTKTKTIETKNIYICNIFSVLLQQIKITYVASQQKETKQIETIFFAYFYPFFVLL